MGFIQRKLRFAVTVLALAAIACGRTARSGASNGGGSNGGAAGFGGEGNVSTVGGSGGVSTECKPGRTPLRRLSPEEYDHSVHDILGDDSTPSMSFLPAAVLGDGFSNDADSYQAGTMEVDGWMKAAEAIAESYRRAGQLALPCKSDAEKCATGFIQWMGKRLFRRPLLDEEVASYLKVFDAGASDGGSFEEGLEWVLERMLQSPYFLYRVELESSGAPAGSVVELNDYSIATRLSYFLWSSAPDEELLLAADRGELGTAEGVEKQVERMVQAPGFETALSSFHRQWLGWDWVRSADKPDPSWSAAVGSSMVTESELVVRNLFRSGGSFQDLLTSSHSFVNPTLASFYGISYPGKGDDFVQVDVPQRAGILTLPSILAGSSSSLLGNPVRRGYWIRKALLCVTTPPEPADLDISNLQEPPPDATSRERFEVHSRMEPCRSCHVFMDPLGFPLEHFDGLGRYRETDNGAPIDASGGLTLVPSRGNETDWTRVRVDGAVDLAKQLSELPEAQRCLVTNWYRFAGGRADEPADTCTIDAVVERFAESGYRLDELVKAIATSDNFRRIQVQP